MDFQRLHAIEQEGNVLFYPIADLLQHPVKGQEALVLDYLVPLDRCPVCCHGSLKHGVKLELLLICQTGCYF